MTDNLDETHDGSWKAGTKVSGARCRGVEATRPKEGRKGARPWALLSYLFNSPHCQDSLARFFSADPLDDDPLVHFDPDPNLRKHLLMHRQGKIHIHTPVLHLPNPARPPLVSLVNLSSYQV